MLNYLRLENVGPAPKMDFDFAPRLNLLTGDNGLGKSFVLDVAWGKATLNPTAVAASKVLVEPVHGGPNQPS